MLTGSDNLTKYTKNDIHPTFQKNFKLFFIKMKLKCKLGYYVLLFLLGVGAVDFMDFVQRLYTGLVHVVLEESWSIW